MKNTSWKTLWMSGVFAVVGWLWPAAQAQETTVMPPPVATAPAPQPKPLAATGMVSVAATGTVTATKQPKSGVNSFFSAATGTSTNSGMEITSDRGEVDYKEMVVAFDGNVHVVDPRYELTCERMLVFMEGTNQINRVICNGKVEVTQPGRHASCERAVYEHATGAIVMTGNPVVMTDVKMGRTTWPKVTVFLNDQRVLGENGGRLSIPTENLKQRDIKP